MPSSSPDAGWRRLRFAGHAITVAVAACLAAIPVLAHGGEPSAGRSVHAERHGLAARAEGQRGARTQVGTASVYARKFAGRKMADGVRMDPNEHVAASKTLPLGTEARVTNLENGRSTRVTIQDRGPYVKGRIVDLSPAAAADVGIKPKEGVAKVQVAPLAVPADKGGARD